MKEKMKFWREDVEGLVKVASEVPRREFDLIEFFKLVKKDKDIVYIEIDVDSHIVSFGIREEG